MSDLKDLPFICLEFRDGDVYPKAPCLKQALVVGAEIREAKRVALATRLQDRYELNKLSTKMPQETNELFLKSLRNTLQENILSLKELSKFSQNNKTAIIMLNKEKSAFLNNLKHAHSLGLLEVVPDQQEESDIKSPIFTSGEIKLHHSIDPSYLVTSRGRSKLHFMIMNNENSQSSSEPILRIFSDEGHNQNPFYHLNVEFKNNRKNNTIVVNDLFRSENHGTTSNISTEQFNRLTDYFTIEGLPDKIDNLPTEVIRYYRSPKALTDSNNPEIRQRCKNESRDEHQRILELFKAESNILEYLFQHNLGKTATSRDNLNLLKFINELLSAQTDQAIVISSGQINSGETFNGKPFYRDELFNTSKKPLDFHTGFISTSNLKIQFLIFDNKKRETIPKLNLKLTDKMRGHSKLLLLDAEKFPGLRDGFQEYLNSFLSLIQKTKLIKPNSPLLKRPERPQP